MKAPIIPRPSVSRRAFSLLELLVVITIIAILATLMFPAAGMIKHKADQAHAKNTALNLKTAITAYQADYRRYPVAKDASEPKVLLSGHELMDVLLASETASEPEGLNPRGIPFFTDKDAKPMGGGKYRRGLRVESDGAGELWDPWGNHYHVLLDLDGNGRIATPNWDGSASPLIYDSVLVWSPGKDPDAPEDNVKTW